MKYNCQCCCMAGPAFEKEELNREGLCPACAELSDVDRFWVHALCYSITLNWFPIYMDRLEEDSRAYKRLSFLYGTWIHNNKKPGN